MILICNYQIGAGPAGMALALTLLENGVKVRLIEKMPTTRIGSRGNGIHVSSSCSWIGLRAHTVCPTLAEDARGAKVLGRC
jgi:2-polyprenyl-6-methoxyphenol hydroxylase-like FAD-dependent oxidoreductase